jgi:hypothetical protein
VRPIHLYCERTGDGLWEEPASLLACLVLMWVAFDIGRRSGGSGILRLMAWLTMALALAALWMHMQPHALSVALTIAAIVMLVLLYFYAVNRDLVELSPRMALVCTAIVLPFAAASLPLIAVLRGASSSVAYVALPILLLGYAAVLRPDKPEAARGLFIGSLIMMVAVLARTADIPLCTQWPIGTHFLWILGVAGLLWHLARVYRRHLLAGLPGGG